jgi:eukaryotic-like serine/threonine-protein kinase
MSADTGAAACPRCGLQALAGRLPFCPACLEQAELPPLRLGGDLELLEPIGEGGMGVVWRARHLRLGHQVAVKVLAEPLAQDPQAVQRLEREARTLARLKHPGIVHVLDLGRDGDTVYIVMELVEGRPLSTLLPLAPERARTVALDVLDALAHAHEVGVVHRDVKPANILVEDGGRVLVSDFGLARSIDPDRRRETLTSLGQAAGTPAYMAPEALAGGAPSPAMDVFAMGMVLYEMVTGTRPAGAFAPLPGDLDLVVRRALAPDPLLRYHDATEMRDALRSAGAGLEDGGLPAEERHWKHAVALVHTLATAGALWALLLSLTPRILPGSDELPLIMLGGARLPDGRILSPARFETWPVLAAAGLAGLALAAQALLRRHWVEKRLERSWPLRAVAESRVVLALGLVSLALYGVRKLAEARGMGALMPYVPMLGGLLELAVVFFAWSAALEAWRTARPLRREIGLWCGLALALVPPVTELTLYVGRFRP